MPLKVETRLGGLESQLQPLTPGLHDPSKISASPIISKCADTSLGALGNEMDNSRNWQEHK